MFKNKNLSIGSNSVLRGGGGLEIFKIPFRVKKTGWWPDGLGEEGLRSKCSNRDVEEMVSSKMTGG